ncbi:unnamed protein product, partial [Polarella glacialis]
VMLGAARGGLEQKLSGGPGARGQQAAQPASQNVIAELLAVLEPYNYGEAEVQSLVKRCGNDTIRIQAAVADILDDHLGHEQDSWANTVTKSDKKDKAAEAKERRMQKEKEMEEEAENVRTVRTQKEDEKFRRLQEELAKRSRNDKTAKLAGPPIGGPDAVPVSKEASGSATTTRPAAWSREAKETADSEEARKAEVAEEEAEAEEAAAPEEEQGALCSQLQATQLITEIQQKGDVSNNPKQAHTATTT